MTKPYSEQTAQIIDEEVRSLVAKAYDRTVKLVEQHKERVEAVSSSWIKQRFKRFLT